MFKPINAYNIVYVNIYLYYAQTILDTLIVIAIFKRYHVESIQDILRARDRKRCITNYLFVASFFVNAFNIGIMYYHW